MKRGRRRTEVDADVMKMFGEYKDVKERARDRERWREDIRMGEMPEPKRMAFPMTLRSQRIYIYTGSLMALSLAIYGFFTSIGRKGKQILVAINMNAYALSYACACA